MHQANMPDVTPSTEDQLENWWLLARQRVQASSRKAFDARNILATLETKKCQGVCNILEQCSTRVLVDRIKDELSQWCLARVSVGVGGSSIRFRE
jgi:hypothetical protein